MIVCSSIIDIALTLSLMSRLLQILEENKKLRFERNQLGPTRFPALAHHCKHRQALNLSARN